MVSHFSSSRNRGWIALGFAGFLSIREAGSWNDSNDLGLLRGWSLHYRDSLSPACIIHTLPLYPCSTSHSVHRGCAPCKLGPSLSGSPSASPATRPNEAQAGQTPLSSLPLPPCQHTCTHSHTHTWAMCPHRLTRELALRGTL